MTKTQVEHLNAEVAQIKGITGLAENAAVTLMLVHRLDLLIAAQKAQNAPSTPARHAPKKSG